MPGLHLEVGNVYRRKSTGKLYLAVGELTMITYTKKALRVLKEIKAGDGFAVERTLSVGVLLEEWEISGKELDQTTVLYLKPSLYRNVGVRQRRTKRRGDNTEELEIFLAIRMHRISVPRHKST